MQENSHDAHDDQTIWKDKSLAALIEHIVETHHAFCRQEVARLADLLSGVIAADGEQHPELKQIKDLFLKMGRDLSMHLVKEEQTLFPYITRLESDVQRNADLTWPPFGTVENPIRIMVVEHDQTDRELAEIRKLSADYMPPVGASGPLKALYEGLAAFDRDMQRHIESENGLLFPRAVAMEDEACGKPKAAKV